MHAYEDSAWDDWKCGLMHDCCRVELNRLVEVVATGERFIVRSILRRPGGVCLVWDNCNGGGEPIDARMIAYVK